MPPKGGAPRGTALGRPVPQKGGYASQVYNGLTDPENRSVVTSLAFFAVSQMNELYGEEVYADDVQAGVAFLHSSWSDLLLPPCACTIYHREKIIRC